MTTCPICSKEDPPMLHSHLIYTAIQDTATIKTGFKQTQTRTRTFDAQKHVYRVCDQCERKWKVIIPAIIWSVAAVLALAAIIFIKHEDPLLVLFCVVPIPLFIAFSINKEFLGLNAKLKKVAKTEREKTNWKQSLNLKLDFDPAYSRAKKDASIVALTEAEYEKMLKKNKK